MMQRMGMNMDSVADVQQVIIRTADKDIVIDEPEVAILQVQGQKMYQIIGGQVSEQAPSQRSANAAAAKPAFSEEDVQLVADQTGRSLEKAKEALQGMRRRFGESNFVASVLTFLFDFQYI